jgi:hypothetical protein
MRGNAFGATGYRSNALLSPNSRRQPGHHCVVGILATDCIRLYDSRRKRCGLFQSLPFVTRKQHPFTDNFTPHVVLGSHRDFLSRSNARRQPFGNRWRLLIEKFV